MGEVKEVNIKNQTYSYYFNNMIDIKNFHSDLLKIDKKQHRDVDIYNIDYNTIKKYRNCNCDSDCDCDFENIRSVNLLYIIMYSATGYFKVKYGELYLTIDSTENYQELFLMLDQKLKPSMVEKNYFIKIIMLELQ